MVHLDSASDRSHTIRVLLASDPQVHAALARIFRSTAWLLHHVTTCREAIEFASSNETAILICERLLPDGDWKSVLNAIEALQGCPSLIVTSRIADEALWAEVLNLGGRDVLAQPFDDEEVLRIVALACP